MKKLKHLLIIFLSLFVASTAFAQTYSVSHLSGTSTVGDNRVNVSGSGDYSTHTCGLAGPYTIGDNGSHTGCSTGSYTWTFCKPVTSIQSYIGALQWGDDVSIEINGSSYWVSSSNLTTWTGCGAANASAVGGLIVDLDPIGTSAGTLLDITSAMVGDYIRSIKITSLSNEHRCGIDASMSFAGSIEETISGASLICEGNSSLLTHPVSGGTWVSSNTGIATVGSSSGVITGVSVGVTVITYTLPLGCIYTHTLTVSAAPASITGTTSVCVGGTSTLSHITSGGIWTSSNIGVATVGSATGVVNGVSIGTTIITYALPNGCYTTVTFTVNPLPNAITGSTLICGLGATTTLSNTSSGGNWTSSNTFIATVTPMTGIVTGLTPGSAIITYSLPTGCYITTTVNVYAAPAPITGITVLCVGNNTMLSDITPGGTWSCDGISIATVGSLSGLVTGISEGTCTISYIIPGGCYSAIIITVLDAPTVLTGIATICVGSATTLIPDHIGGTWFSTVPTVATVGITGDITGLSPGITTIKYTNMCGVAVKDVTVNPLPAAITGSTSLCTGVSNAITLSNAISGGSWSSSNTAIADVGSSTGVVTGVTGGTATITYMLPTGCYTTIVVNVLLATTTISGDKEVCIGGTSTLTAGYSGGVWSSSATAIATIGSSTGILTGVAGGTAIITYSYMCGYATTTVTVVDACVNGDGTYFIFSGPTGAVITYDLTTMYGTTTATINPISVLPTMISTYACTVCVTSVSYGTATCSVSCCAKWDATGTRDMRLAGNAVYRDSIRSDGNLSGSKSGVVFKLLPNPNKGVFEIEGYLEGLTKSEEALIEIVDIMGRVMQKMTLQSENGYIVQSISLEEQIPNGSYIVRLKNSQINQVLRLSLER